MKETFKLIFVLTIICVLAGSLLAYVNDLTRKPIDQAKFAEKMHAIQNILPDCDNAPGENTYRVNENGSEWIFYIGRKNNEFSGAAFEAVSSKGYGGDITVMIGIDHKEQLLSVQILDQKETPGLGAKIKTEKFRSVFVGKDILKTRWAVKKDGGDIDQITAATISSRAVTDAIKTGIDVFIKHKDAIILQSK